MNIQLTILQSFHKILLDYSEVWALFIPLLALYKNRQQPKFLQPVILYIWIAFIIDVAIDIIMTRNDLKILPRISNNWLYNVHSMVRYVCFSYFFVSLDLVYYRKILKALPIFSVFLIVINFAFVPGEDLLNFDKLSGNLFTIEAYFLLIGCMIYYLSRIKEDKAVLTSGKDFWVVTGISLYVVINFFVFLFYDAAYHLMLKGGDDLVNYMWNFHNYAFIILCLFLAKAFYVKDAVRYRPA